jgi:melibiose permease/lactose/raffinose/galactose permease
MTNKKEDYSLTFKSNKWFFSLGSIGKDMVYSLVVSYLLTYIQFGVTLSSLQYLIVSLSIGVVGRLFDAFTDPLMGYIIQKYNFKFGKYRPWIFIGAILTGFVTVMLFSSNLNGWYFVVYIIVMNLIWEVAFTINDISYWAMLPSLTSEVKERNILSTMTLFFAGVGGGIIQGLITIFQTGNIVKTYSLLSVISCISIIFFQGLTSVFVKERKELITNKYTYISFKSIIKTITSNKQLLIASISLAFYSIGNGVFVSLFYNIYYIELGYNGDVVFVLALFAILSSLVQLLFTFINKYISTKKIFTISMICSLSGYFLFLIGGMFKVIPFNLSTISLCGFLIYSGNSLIHLILLISITNCVEYNQYITGKREEALISAIRPFVVKISTAIRYGITILILVCSGVFSLSQNISSLESQKIYFSKINSSESYSSFDIKLLYLSTLQESYMILDDSTLEEKSLQQLISLLNDKLEKNELLNSFKLDMNFIDVYVEMYLLEDNKPLGKIKDIDLSLLDENKEYLLSLKGTYKGEKYNVGDLLFKDKATREEKIILRSLSSFICITCIFLSWNIHRKYYLIDQQFYQKILNQLKNDKN